MALNEQEIKLIIKAFKEGKGLEDTILALSDIQKKGKESQGAIGGLVGELKGLLPALGAAAVIASMKGMSDSALQYADAVDKVSDITGESAEQSSKWVLQAQHVGTSADTVANGLAILSKNLVSGNKAFEDFKIKTTDAHGAMLPLNSIIEKVRDREKELGEGANSTAMEMALFGKSGKELHDFLTADNTEMESVAKTAESLGLVFSDLSKDKIEQMNRKLNDMKMIQQALGTKLNEELLPILIRLGGIALKITENLNAIFELPKYMEAKKAITEHNADLKTYNDRIVEITDSIKKQNSVTPEQQRELILLNEKIKIINNSFHDQAKELLDDKPYKEKAKQEKILTSEQKAEIKARQKAEEEAAKESSRIEREKYEAKWEKMSGETGFLKKSKKDQIIIEKAFWDDVIKYASLSELDREKIRKKYNIADKEANKEELDGFLKMQSDMQSGFSSTILNFMQKGGDLKDFLGNIFNDIVRSWETMIADMIAKWAAAGLMNAVSSTWNAYQSGKGGSPVAPIIPSTNTIGDTLSKVGNGVSNVVKSIPVIGNVVSAIGSVTDNIRLSIPIGYSEEDKMQHFGPFRWAEGGIITKPTYGLAGEAGPEAVIPLDKAKQKGFGLGGNTYNITIQAGAMMGNEADAMKFAKTIQSYLTKIERRNLTL